MYDIDYDYEFQQTDEGFDIIPKGCKLDDGLYVLPNGRYMPPGVYYDAESGMDVIYEPFKLSPMYEKLRKINS